MHLEYSGYLSRQNLLSEPESKAHIINQGCRAAFKGRLEMVCHVLAEGAYPNFVPFENWTWDERYMIIEPPLYKALHGLQFDKELNVDDVRALVDAGADPMQTNEQCATSSEINRNLNGE